MPIRTTRREDIERLAKPLWLLLNACSWKSDATSFDQLKSAALGIVAHLAYCDVDSEEIRYRYRAKVTPCEIYQRIIEGGEISNVVEILGRMDFVNCAVLRTRRYVALIVPAREMLLIGVRGTQFAYDWFYNLRAHKRRGNVLGSRSRFHAGFLAEAGSLAYQIQQYIQGRHATDGPATERVHLSGHSLGGAIAAILNATSWAGPTLSVESCYIYGAPRIASATALRHLRQPFPIRRTSDPVPHVPPKQLNYGDYTYRIQPDGAFFNESVGPELWNYAKWLLTLKGKRFIENHCIERYRCEMMKKAGKDHRVHGRWNGPGPFA